jgi:hypothetical protein
LGTTGQGACTENNNPAFNLDSLQCGKKVGSDLECPNKTGTKIKDAYQKGLIKNTVKAEGRDAIKTALNEGPVVSIMDIWSDIFFWPKDKPYVPTAGGSLGYYAVKIVGYVETKSTTPTQGYWKVLLPFDDNVGDDGIVQIQAGLNIGNIEGNAQNILIETNLLKPTP